MESILRRWGHPMLVAQRYLPQQYLIGPVWFPVYRFVLKMVALCYLLPWLLTWIVLAVFLPEHRTPHSLQSFLLIAVFAFTAVTVGFAFAERSRILESWSPRKLPADPNRISRSESIGDLVGSLVFALWLLDVLRLPSIEGVPIHLAPIWSTLYWPILLLMFGSIALSAVNTVRPWWTRLRSGFRLAIDAFALTLICILLAARSWVEVTASSDKLDELARWANLSIAITLGAIGIAMVVGIVRGIRRLRRPRPALVGALSA
ncbi:MAG: hypothetical protein ACLGI9_03305, partial [Thermoanaerobaculia bacterium]